MSDEFAKHVEAETPQPEPSGRSITLSITLHPNGQVDYSLPSNFVVGHGLLGMAAAKLTEMQLMVEAKRQATANGMGGLLRKMGRG